MLTINSKVLYSMLAMSKPITTASLQASYATVLLEAENGVLSAKSTDTVSSFRAVEQCEVEKPFAACLQPALLMAVLEGKDTDAVLSYDGTQISVKCGSTKAKLATINSKDFLYPLTTPLDKDAFDGSGVKSILQFCADEDSWKASVTFLGKYAYATDGLTIVRTPLAVDVPESIGVRATALKNADFCLVPNARFGFDKSRLCLGVGGASVSILRDASSNGEPLLKMFEANTVATLEVSKKSLSAALLSVTRIAPEEMRCVIDAGESVVLSCDATLANVSHELVGASANGVKHFELSALRLHKAVVHLGSEKMVTFKFAEKFVIINNNIIMALLGAWT